MSEHDTGGPAFPVSTESAVTGHQDGPRTWQFPGATLRDYFAAKALPSAVMGNWRDLEYAPLDGLSLIGNAARLAYQLADAMLAERSK